MNDTGSDSQSPLRDPPLRHPGQSLDEQIDDFLDGKVLPYLLFPAVFWLFALILWVSEHHPEVRSPIPWVCAALLMTVVAVWRLYGVRREIRNIKLGRDGERVVGQALEELRRQGAEVFHDLPGKGFNLDHVVVARQGVFVIETKTWSKRKNTKERQEIAARDGVLFKDGKKVDRQPVDQVRANTDWLGGWLKEHTRQTFPIQPVVLLPFWWVNQDEATKAKAWVLSHNAFPKFFAREVFKLSDADVALASARLKELSRGRL